MSTRTLTVLAALAALFVVPVAAHADSKVASATGVKHADGEKYFVDVLVAVPAGQTARQATNRALHEQGAKRKPSGGGGGSAYAYTGLVWSAFPVVQSYNSVGEPAGPGAAAALQRTQSTLSSISGSSFRMSYGGATTRCPSLVNECPGARSTDRRNDVGWARLSGGTLGVTWWTTSTPEADMALNSRFTWKNTCGASGSGYDVETVLLHENGHVAGLDHSSTTSSVMYPSYQTPACALFGYDLEAMANLY
jgi:hypothetical protein